MFKFYILVVVTTVTISPTIYAFTFSNTDLQVLHSLAKYFNAGACIVEKNVEDGMADEIMQVAYSAKHYLLTASLDFSEILNVIQNSGTCHSKIMIFLKMNNETIWALEKLSISMNITSAVIWTLFSDSEHESNTFLNIYIPFDCEFLFVHRKASEYAILEMYHVTKNSRMETYNLGTWTKEKGLSVTDLPFYVRRNNLKNHTFFGIFNNDPPYTEIQTSETGKPVFGGYFYEIWRELEASINFRTEFPAEYFDKEAKKVLNLNDLEFALGKISMTSRNMLFLDFVHPIVEAQSYAFGHRRGGELDWDSYIKPFSAEMWYAFLIWMAASALALTIAYRLAWNFGTSERQNRSFIFTASESVLTVLRAVCVQGSDIMPKSYSCRLIFLNIYLTAFVVTTAFSAALFSLLTVPKRKSHFNSLNELFNNRSYEIAFPADSSFQKALECECNECYTPFPWTSKSTLTERIMESNFKLHLTAVEGLHRICEDRFLVFIYDMPNVLYLMQNMTRYCRNKIIPLDRPLLTEYVTYGLRKNSPYKKIINLHLSRIRDMGILNRIYLNSWPPRIPHVPTQWSKATTSDVSPIFGLLFFGIFNGVFFVVAEKFFKYVRRKRIRRKVKTITDGSMTLPTMGQGLLFQKRLSYYHTTEDFVLEKLYSRNYFERKINYF